MGRYCQKNVVKSGGFGKKDVKGDWPYRGGVYRRGDYKPTAYYDIGVISIPKFHRFKVFFIVNTCKKLILKFFEEMIEFQNSIQDLVFVTGYR